MTKYGHGEHPARLQTRTGWVRLGWRVREDGQPSGDRLTTEYGKFPLFDYTGVEPIPGQRAWQRRMDFMLSYLGAVVERQAFGWSKGRADVTDELIQDMAVTAHLQIFDVFFGTDIVGIPVHRLTDRLRFAFELGALEGLGREYGSYRYNDF